jgi:hypothetical protein
VFLYRPDPLLGAASSAELLGWISLRSCLMALCADLVSAASGLLWVAFSFAASQVLASGRDSSSGSAA